MKTVKVRKRQTGADRKQNPMLIKQLGHRGKNWEQKNYDLICATEFESKTR